VHPLSNLIATEQVQGGDMIRVDYSPSRMRLTFVTEAEDIPAYAMVQLVDSPSPRP